LLGFIAPPGARACDARIGLTAPERIGAAISLASLVALGLYLLALLIPRRARSG
jgi:hypothetical protein